MKNDVIKIKESEFRISLGIGADEPINIKRLLQKLSTLTLYKKLSDDFSGMCLKSKEKTFILVNSTQARGRQHFTIAHELYHLFIQKDFKVHKCNPGQRTKDPQEKEADFFASIFLMPEMGVKKMIPEDELIKKNVSVSTVIKLEHYFAVSRSAMLNRLHGLNLISQAKYDELKTILVIKSAKEHGADISLYLPGNEGLIIGDYGDKAKRLFDNEKISEGHYLDLLSKIGIDLTSDYEDQPYC